MRKALFTILFSALLPALVFAQNLRVAVAANAQFVARKLEAAFAKETGIKAELVVSSSGKLTAQIRAGAPYDVFLSADTQYPEALYTSKLTTGKPRVYAYGKLVFWSKEKAAMLPYLASGQGKTAIANPKTAPYGVAAMSVLTKTDLLEKVKPRLVYAESIAQVTQYMQSGAANAAFTAKSIALEPAIKKTRHWVEIDPQLYDPIAQSAVVLKSARDKTAATKFYRFLFSKTARRIFLDYGYGL